MKEFNLESINKQIQEMLEEILVELQKFEELKECYIKNNAIMINDVTITKIYYTLYIIYFDNDFNLVWEHRELNREEVFEKIGNNLTSIKIKEPQPHQAKKKTLEEIEIGDSYYEYEFKYGLSVNYRISNPHYWENKSISTKSELIHFKNLLKHSRMLIALDEEEIKSKVLD